MPKPYRRPKMHWSITPTRILALAEQRELTLSNPGLCLTCGQEQEGCEPDAREYLCESCGERTVYAPEEIVIAWPFSTKD